MKKTLVVPPGKVAVILGGGGFVGAFIIGALKGLVRLGIPIDELICVSVGSIIGAGFVENGNSPDKGERVFLSIKEPKEVFRYTFKSTIWEAFASGAPLDYVFVRRIIKRVTSAVMNIESIYKSDGIVELITKNIDARKVVDSGTKLIITTTAVRKVNGRYKKSVLYASNHDEEFKDDPAKFLSYVYGSCAIPGALPKIMIERNGEQIWLEDGAYSHPLPILKAIEKDGCDTVIVIRTHSDSIESKLTHKAFQELSEGASTQTARREKEEIRTARRLYPNKNIIVIEPEELTSTLDSTTFKPGDFEKAIAEGLAIALRELAPLAEYYTNAASLPKAQEDPKGPDTEEKS